eukprot:1058748-Pleurochrysis_carterae.AAC.2
MGYARTSSKNEICDINNHMALDARPHAQLRVGIKDPSFKIQGYSRLASCSSLYAEFCLKNNILGIASLLELPTNHGGARRHHDSRQTKPKAQGHFRF